MYRIYIHQFIIIINSNESDKSKYVYKNLNGFRIKIGRIENSLEKWTEKI